MVLIYAFTQQAKLSEKPPYKVLCTILYGPYDMGRLKSKDKDVQMYVDTLAADMAVLQCRSKNAAQQNEYVHEHI